MTDIIPTLHPPPTEPPPLGKHHERQFFPVEVFDGLDRFVGRVREPHLPRLFFHLYKYNLRLMSLILKP